MNFQLKKFIDAILDLSYQNFPSDGINRAFKETPSLLIHLDSFINKDIKKPYTRNLVYQTKDFDLIAMYWRPESKSPIHGHENQKCWMRVESGILTVTNYKENKNESLAEINQQQATTGSIDGPAIIHKVENLSDQQAISLHLYARPFQECTVYCPDSNEQKRIKLSFDNK